MKPMSSASFAQVFVQVFARALHRLSALASVLCLGLLLNAQTALANSHESQETELLQAIEQMQAGNIDQAINTLDKILEHTPNFRIAQLILADAWDVKAGKVNELRVGLPQYQTMIDEARQRARHIANAGKLPSALLQIGPEDQSLAVVDLSHNRLYLYEQRNGELKQAANFYASIGSKGIGKDVRNDGKTPLGVYRITEFKPGQQLHDRYGVGALVLDYPNALDQEAERTGDGIWLHGVSRSNYSRPPRSSQGCVTVSNPAMELLISQLPVGSTVVLAETIDWLSAAALAQQQNQLRQSVEAWRSAWQSLNTELYLGFYADNFSHKNGWGKSRFAAHKRRVNAAKTHISVELSNLRLYRYPGEDGRVLASFTQTYASNNYRSESEKLQLWQQDADGRWQISYEGELD